MIRIDAWPNIRLEYITIESAVLKDYRHFYSNAIAQKQFKKIFSIFGYFALDAWGADSYAIHKLIYRIVKL